jgi:hypothetical protein
MTTDDKPAVTGQEADLDLYAIGADFPDGGAVVLITEIDLPDRRFVGRWSSEEELLRVWDGDLYVRLRRTDRVSAVVDADLILAHDGRLMTFLHVRGVAEWAKELLPTAAGVMTLHTDLESGETCKPHAEGVIGAR